MLTLLKRAYSTRLKPSKHAKMSATYVSIFCVKNLAKTKMPIFSVKNLADTKTRIFDTKMWLILYQYFGAKKFANTKMPIFRHLKFG
jgi:hypothetical protein